MVTLPEFGIIVGVVTGSTSLGLVIYKTLKEKPRIKCDFVDASWFKRNDNSIVTSFGIHILTHNTGEKNTTVYSAKLKIDYDGKPFSIDSEYVGVMVTSGSSTLKQFIFNLPIEQITISKDITKSTLFLNHTYGTKKIQIPLIKKPL